MFLALSIQLFGRAIRKDVLKVRPGGDCFVASLLALTRLNMYGVSPPDPTVFPLGKGEMFGIRIT